MKKEKRRFNLSNKLAYTLIATFAIIFLGIGVYALSATGGDAGNPGHNINSIGAPSSCASGQYLKWNGGTWTCATPASGTTLPSCDYGDTIKYSGGSWLCDYATSVYSKYSHCASVATCLASCTGLADVIVGGGCTGTSANLKSSYPVDDISNQQADHWLCEYGSTQSSMSAYVICLNPAGIHVSY